MTLRRMTIYFVVYVIFLAILYMVGHFLHKQIHPGKKKLIRS